jgi:hypothetical protein
VSVHCRQTIEKLKRKIKQKAVEKGKGLKSFLNFPLRMCLLAAAVLFRFLSRQFTLQFPMMDYDQFPKGARQCLENNRGNHPKKLFVLT